MPTCRCSTVRGIQINHVNQCRPRKKCECVPLKIVGEIAL